MTEEARVRTAMVEIEGIRGLVRQDELDLLRTCVLELADTCFPVCEIGALCGLSTVSLAKAAREKDTLVYSIDTHGGIPGVPSTSEEFRRNLLAKGISNVVEVMQMTSDEAFLLIEQKDIWFSFVFIDGDHDYSVVARDFQNYGSRVRKDGVIALHDVEIYPDGPGRVLRENVGCGYVFEKSFPNLALLRKVGENV